MKVHNCGNGIIDLASYYLRIYLVENFLLKAANKKKSYFVREISEYEFKNRSKCQEKINCQ